MNPLISIRKAGLLFPPWGLWRIWHSPALPSRTRIYYSLFLLLYLIPYTVLITAPIVWGLMRFTGLELEWQGGFPPVLTFHKTKPDYEAVEVHRARQAPPAAVTPLESAGTYWTGFRGPKRDGHYTERPIRTRWNEHPPTLLWKQPIGGGYASFAIAHGRAYTIEQRRELEVVAAYDLRTGRELWTHSYPAFFSESMGGEGPRATPVYAEGKVYSLGAQGRLVCLEATNGQPLWTKEILADNQAANLPYGMAASPLILGEQIVVLPGGGRGRSVVAYHKDTGQQLWSALDDQAAYTAPVLVEFLGETQLLVVTATRALGLSPTAGQVRWEFPWRVQYDNSIAQPVILGTNRFLLSGGYGKGCVAVELRNRNGSYEARTAWQNKFLKNKFASSVFWAGHIYGLDEDILTCLDAVSGARRWKEGRYGYGQLVLASEHLIILCGNGDLALVTATPEKHQEIARIPALRGKTWNHPALSDGFLLIRNAVEMACYDLR